MGISNWASGKFAADGTVLTAANLTGSRFGTGLYDIVLDNAIGVNEIVPTVTPWMAGAAVLPDVTMLLDGNTLRVEMRDLAGNLVDAGFSIDVQRVN